MPNAKTNFFIAPEGGLEGRVAGRFCWQFLDVPRDKDAAGVALKEPRYETVFYLPKQGRDPQSCPAYQALARRIQEVLTQQFGGTWPQIDPRTQQWIDYPIHDCDLYTEELKTQPWGAGHWRIRLSAGKYPPTCCDEYNVTLARDLQGRFRDFRNGDYGIASINCFGYENAQFRKKGVSFGLEGVKKIRSGDPIGSGVRSPEQMFGPSTVAPQQQPTPPPSYAQPQYAPQPVQQPQYAPQPVQQPQYALPPGQGAQAYPTREPAYAPSQAPAPTYAPAPVGMPPVQGGPAQYPSSAPPAPPVYGQAPPGAQAPGYGPPQSGMPPAPPIGQR